MKAETILKEVDASIARLTNAAIIDQKVEFLGNIYPLLKLLAQSQVRLEKELTEDIRHCEDAVAEMIVGSDDRIHQRLANRIKVTIDLGAEVCAYATKDASAKNPPPQDLLMLIQTYRDSATIVLQMVDEVLVAEEDDEDEEEQPDGTDNAKD